MYKWCAVPDCSNTTIKTPEKLFVCVPKKIKMRRKWLELARRNPDSIRIESTVFFCEDHFDMEKDMNNYCQYKMGFSQKVLMRDGVLPSKFDCQKDRSRRKKKSDSSTSRSAYIKRQRIQLIQECKEEMQSTAQRVKVETPLIKGSYSLQSLDKSTLTEHIPTVERAIQCSIKRLNRKIDYRSKAVQTRVLKKDIALSP